MARQRRLHRPHCHASVLIDQDLDHVILRRLLLRVTNLNVITAHQASLSNASDPEVLAWVAEQERTLVPHNGRTMPYHAASRIARAENVIKHLYPSRSGFAKQIIERRLRKSENAQALKPKRSVRL
ncbi:MAG TPA: hypothetical protein VN843_07200 [Anaerolineales bacterium]|nr:hypothetical protein [Anaerolineales bacterium]